MVKILNDSPLFIFEKNLQDICAPLMDGNKRIVFFDYARVYKTGAILPLTTNAKLSKYVYENDNTIFKYITLDVAAKMNLRLLSSTADNEFMSTLKNQFAIDNVLVVTDKYPDYIDIFGFGGNAQDSEILNYYLANLSVLGNFAKDFAIKAAAIIKSAQHKKIVPVADIVNIYKKIFAVNLATDKIDDVSASSMLTPSNEFKTLHNRHIILSSRESECLSYLTRGYTMKLVAEKMGISVRTVESHFNSIKNKFGCNSKAEVIRLIDNFQDNLF